MNKDDLHLEERKFALEERKFKNERTQLFVSIFGTAIMPLALVFFGYWIQSSLNRIENDQKTRELKTDLEWKTGERRAAQREKVYAELGPCLNIIYCYLVDVGDFGNYTPAQIIAQKRNADRLFFSYNSYWSEPTALSYQQFMKAAFVTYTGVGKAAQIRADWLEKQRSFENRTSKWQMEWNDSFADRDPDVEDIYFNMVKAFLSDLQTNNALMTVKPEASTKSPK